ncbi:MAG: metalloregulator ArsR/SmtB family transcription factor [Rhodoblastus sp.]
MDKSNLAHAAQAAADFAMMVEKAREASDFLKALSHESRLLLLCALSEGECSVGELENILGERQSTVSQQLARLRLDRLVATRRDGKTIYYSLADENVRAILDALRKAFCEPDEERATKAKKSASTAQAKLKAARR